MRGFNKEAMSMTEDFSYCVLIILRRVLTLFFRGKGYFLEKLLWIVYKRIDNGRRKMERWLTDVWIDSKYIFVRIMVKLDVKLDLRRFIKWLILKPRSLACVCVFALAHWYVFMCISVPVRYLEMVDEFWRKKYFYNPAHTISKLRLLKTFSQKKFEKQVI